IQDWLARGEILKSENRKIRAGDILILVRKRNPFAVPMVAALKTRKIPVAGSDRIALTAQIAVQDLLALGDFLTLPEDDLALATVLKGPLFNFNDDDLLVIANGRKGPLWRALLAAAGTAPNFKSATEALKRWRAKADFTPPFEFFSSVLDRDGARTKMLHRLGAEAADAIDEFLDLALAYDDVSPPSLTGFLADLRAADREVKRDMDHARNEVRVMTVHGAKGLEAPIVFLPDTCTTMSGDGAGTRLLKMPDAPRPSSVPPPVIWQVKGTSRVAAVRAATAVKDAREAEERNRLLYVAMTRARDRLYVGGFEGKKRAAGCWYDAIFDSLSPHLERTAAPDGTDLWRLESKQTADYEKPKSAHSDAEVSQALPAFAARRAALEPQLTVPLAPSRLEPYAPDSEGEPLVAPRTPADPAADRSLPSPSTLVADNRFLRGTISHALLQYLPEMADGERKAAATAFVAARGAALASKVRISIVRETLAVLNTPEFAPLFSPTSRAEVPISAIIPRPGGKGPALRLSGQIDRLAVTEHEVMIVDYKTNRPPPLELQGVAPAYLYQLAAYALALADIYPGRRLRAALLWTDGPRLMEIPEIILREYAAKLWNLDVTSLDVTGVDTYVPAPN
ncbi:MAG: 3'-5' exonuclease, partial [Hyphomicrobium sp.]